MVGGSMRSLEGGNRCASSCGSSGNSNGDAASDGNKSSHDAQSQLPTIQRRLMLPMSAAVGAAAIDQPTLGRPIAPPSNPTLVIRGGTSVAKLMLEAAGWPARRSLWKSE